MPAYELLDPYGAEIQFFIHHHGPQLPQFMPDMIQTVAGGCTDAGIPAAGADSPFNNYCTCWGLAAGDRRLLG